MRKLIFIYFFLYCSTTLCQDLPAAVEALDRLQSVYDDSYPVISADGKAIYFSRKGHPQNKGEDDHYDIWIAFRQSDEEWSKAVNMPAPLNNKNDNFVIASTLDGLTLFLNDTYNRSESGLVFTQKKGRTWSRLLPVDIQNFRKLGQVSFSLADNGQVILLTQNAPAGYGGRDIYIAEQIDEQTWSEPINLGAVINSSREEFHACLAADNKTIYFLSNGYANPKLLRLMVSQRVGSDWLNWTEPVFTGIELDPSHFKPHFSIEPDGTYLYCAGLPIGKNDKQLFQIPIPELHHPEPTALVTGELIDAETGASLEGEILLQSLVANGKSVQRSTNKEGRFQFVLPYQKEFALAAEVPGYFAKSETIANRSLQELDKESDQNNTGNRVRVSPEADELQVRLQQLNRSMLDLDQRKKAIKLTADSRPRAQLVPKGGDAQLNALKQKYYKALGVETVSQKEDISSGDSELDEMKRAFRKHNNVRANNKAQVSRSGESQLEAMKRKYNEANNNNNSDGAKEEEAVVASVAEVPYDFTELVDQSRTNLETELSERVVKELKADLLQEVSFKMHAEMDTDMRSAYAGTLQKQTGMLEADLRKELRRKYKAEVKRELKGELLELVEEELRELLREEVKRELRESLEEEVREELRLELEYLLTKEMAEDVQKELNGLLKQLKKESESAPANYYKEEDIQAKGTKVQKGQQKIHLQLYPLKAGRIIPLNNIHFGANSADWKESALPELDRIYNLMINNPELIIEISGHTNGWCSSAFANELSSGRSKAVADYLFEKGIEQGRVVWKGYGKTQPLFPNDSVENCKKNQRLELKILENN